MITALEIVFNVLLGVGLAVGYLATGVHVAHRQFEIFVKAGQPRETALSRSRHLIMDWAPYVMIDGIRAIGALIDGKICDVPLTDAEREAEIKKLEIATGVIPDPQREGIDRMLETQARLAKCQRELALNPKIDRSDLEWSDWVPPADRYASEHLSGRTREDKEVIEVADGMASRAVKAGLCGYRTSRPCGESNESLAEKICYRAVDALHHHEGEHLWVTVAKRQR